MVGRDPGNPTAPVLAAAVGAGAAAGTVAARVAAIVRRAGTLLLNMTQTSITQINVSAGRRLTNVVILPPTVCRRPVYLFPFNDFGYASADAMPQPVQCTVYRWHCIIAGSVCQPD